MRSQSDEPALLRKQYELGAGIFACDDSIVFSDGKKSLAPDYVSTMISPAGPSMFDDRGLFRQVWDKVKADGSFKSADWVVKVAPDTVFFPARLRARVGGPMHSRTHSTFFANCVGEVAAGSKRKHWEHEHFMSPAFQVYSFKAVDTFF